MAGECSRSNVKWNGLLQANLQAIVFLIVCCASGIVFPAHSNDAPTTLAPFAFGEYQVTIENLSDPAAVAIGPDGFIFIAEAGRDRVSVYSRVGVFARSIPAGDGVSDGLRRPMGVDVDENGVIYIADSGQHRVVVFNPEGKFLRAWGTFGAANGQFNEPRGISVRDGRVYVTDLGNRRVQIFDDDGVFIRAFGRLGDDDGAFKRPLDVAADDAGNVYVADADNSRIQKFDANGEFVQAWGDWGPFAGLMDEPSGVVFRDGQLHIAERRNHRVQTFGSGGELMAQWGTHAAEPHEGEGRLHYPNDLAIAPDNSFGVICEGFENRCQIFAARKPDAVDDANAFVPKKMKAHFGERIDIDGNLLVLAEPENHRIYLFETSGDVPIIIGEFGDRGSGFGLTLRIAGLAIDRAQRAILITDTATSRIQQYAFSYDPDEMRRFDPKRARFATAIVLARMHAALKGKGISWAIEPSSIERGPEGNLYIVDPRNARVLVFDSALNLARSWGGEGEGDAALAGPTDVAFSRDGETVYVVDANNRQIEAFDRTGAHRSSFGQDAFKPADAAAQTTQAGTDSLRGEPFGIAAGQDGFIYVTDPVRDRVVKFTEAGAYVKEWGERGVEHGQFWNPKGIAQDEQGRIFVVDYGNHRVQIFSPDGEWLVTFSTGRAKVNHEALERFKAAGKGD